VHSTAPQGPTGLKQTAPPPRIGLTLLTNYEGRLTKKFWLTPNGTLVKAPGGQVTYGSAERIWVTGVAELAQLAEGQTSSQAFALGTLRADLPDKVEVTTKRRLLNGVARPDLIARTNANIVYDGRSLALLDYDTTGMPVAVRTELERANGFLSALLAVLPDLKDTALLVRRSTSARLWRTDTGEALPGSDGLHVYLEIVDGTDSARFLKALHDRCWLAGFGWMVVSTSGSLLERSIIDRTVGASGRPVFEGPPVLEPPLRQRRRQAFVVPGQALDTKAACPPLSLFEQERLKELKDRERERLAPEMAKARAAFVEAQAKKLVTRTGMPEKAARQVIVRQCEGVLRPDVVLPFDDPDLNGCTVGDVLADPERFVDETLADPLEGVEYGVCKAKIMRRADGAPWIHSFAHGRTIYELKYDAASVRKAMESAAKDEVVATLVRLAVVADLDEVELEELRRLAHKLSDIGLNPIKATLKAALQKQAAQDAKWVREHHAAQRDDPRPQIQAPLPDAEWLPLMDVLNKVIGAAVGTRPPSRDIDDDAMRVRKLPVLNMHAFTQSGANAEPEEAANGRAAEAEATTKLPPPEQWVFCKMNEMEVAEMIEKHINFYVEDKNGNRRSVHLGNEFVKHYLQRDDGVLPTIVAIATSPIVLADRVMLAPEGLDRERGIQFIIPDELRAFIPRREDCTPDAVKAAMGFLCDEWLVDVATNHAGKATIIAAALTLIERSLLPDRPCFFITAGRRGSGKTTTITMMIMAVTGGRPAAAAWSSDENERRKALLAYFMAGVPYILWDNIPRGTQVSCPHIERSCTTALYADRKLGVSEAVITAASTINLFTGNNIGVKGDLASRSLHIRLDVDRADPENRNFKHPDPVGWTESHRGKILRALYTLLLGNPQLKAARDAPAKTRYKMWWRLVGSAVENAAKLAGQELDFKDLFIRQEEDDEESASLGDVLDILMKKWPKGFAPLDLVNMVNKPREYEAEEARTVREFLLAGEERFISEKSIGKLLKPYLDAAVLSGLVLRKYKDTHTRAVTYYVKRLEEGK
jgi:hypothetical protein